MGPGLSVVQSVIAKYAVVIGWNFDSTDSLYDDGSNCMSGPLGDPCPTGAALAQFVMNAVGTPGNGTNGIILMHGLFPWTHDALKLLFDPVNGQAVKAGFRLGTAEDVVCWKYGMHSWDIINLLNHYTGTPQERKPN
jgi:hypothetical protein